MITRKTAHCAVIVFARAPVHGQAKTRLIPALGAAEAARLAARMLDAMLAQAHAAALGPVVLCATPDPAASAFAPYTSRYPQMQCRAQGEGDLGARMERALRQLLGQTARVLLVGTDIPALDATCLQAAEAALHTHDAVFVPTHDGGYGLVGLRAPAPALFERVAWSTASVMQTTRERVAALGLRHVELPTLFDVDEPADLVHVPPAWLNP